MRALFYTSIVLFAISLSALQTVAADTENSAAGNFEEAFARLKMLEGVWDEAPFDDGTPGRIVRYRLTGEGSALIEEFIGEPPMSTVYHLDGDGLMLTHYCNAGNQPRMRASYYDGHTLKFDFVDVTNLSAPEAYHTRTLEVTFHDDDRIDLNFVGLREGRDIPGLVPLTRRTAIEDGR